MSGAILFGVLPDGRQVRAVTLRSGTMTARVLTLGAIVQDLRWDKADHPLMLGCPDVADYLDAGRYLGAIVGRFANRIGNARFRLDGRDYQTDPNFRDRHTLHGGSEGTDLQIWQIETLAPDRVMLRLTLADGHMGFPGTMGIAATIALSQDTMSITLQAETDQPTPCNLTHHGYFNLDGGGDVRCHHLNIDAAHYLPVDADLIPTGEITPVEGTPFDFRRERMIGDTGYDHNFCLSRSSGPMRPVARLTGQGGISMDIVTTACGLQLYDGVHLSDLQGLEGRVYGPHAGAALEAQHWPDAPNQPDFPKAILRPGEVFDMTVSYRFSR
ncbi:aldose epimerase family protein [Paracoccus sp. (in: a-proteobacteria)]|uniref:aldose epimerase family protein n=1 Tax=Paracoccus sp. TaxID=267 RepID=UPI00396CC98E